MKRARLPAAPAALAAAVLLATPTAAQLTAPADPSGDYTLAVVPNGSGCPQLYPNWQAVLSRVSANEYSLTIAGSSGTMLYRPDRQSLQGLISSLFGYGPVAVSGTADDYQGRTTLDLTFRWTDIDCLVTGSGSVPSNSTSTAAEPLAAGNTAGATPAGSGPAAGSVGSSATTAAPMAAASAEEPGTIARQLRDTPFWVKLALVAWAAILLGWMLGKALARRRS